MTDEELERFERELAGLRPAELSGAVGAGVARGLAEAAARQRRADRVLASFVTAGAMAACVIVGMTVWQVAATATPVGGPMAVRPVDEETQRWYYQALADGGHERWRGRHDDAGGWR